MFSLCAFQPNVPYVFPGAIQEMTGSCSVESIPLTLAASSSSRTRGRSFTFFAIKIGLARYPAPPESSLLAGDRYECTVPDEMLMKRIVAINSLDCFFIE